MVQALISRFVQTVNLSWLINFSDRALELLKLQQLRVQKARQILCAYSYVCPIIAGQVTNMYVYCYLIIVKQSMKMHMRDVPTVIGSDRC